MMREITIHCTDKGRVRLVRVKADVKGPLAIHLDTYELDYVITHELTGLKIVDEVLTFAQALAYRDELLALDVNWYMPCYGPEFEAATTAVKAWKRQKAEPFTPCDVNGCTYSGAPVLLGRGAVEVSLCEAHARVVKGVA